MGLPTWVSDLLLAAGSLFTMTAVKLALGVVRLRQTAERTTGTVLENVRRPGEDGPVYAPRFQFVARNGFAWEVVAEVSTSPPLYRPGQRVRVLYRPEAPEAAKIDSFTELWTLPAILGGLGIAALLAGVWHLLHRA